LFVFFPHIVRPVSESPAVRHLKHMVLSWGKLWHQNFQDGLIGSIVFQSSSCRFISGFWQVGFDSMYTFLSVLGCLAEGEGEEEGYGDLVRLNWVLLFPTIFFFGNH
jgi:hypothetical protein